jgi:adenylate cyclase
LEIDPQYGVAATIAGGCHFLKIAQAWAADPKSETAEGLRLLRLALSIGGNDPEPLSLLGRLTAFSSDDLDTAREMVDRAVASNPNSAFAWNNRGWATLVNRRLAGPVDAVPATAWGNRQSSNW